MELIYSSVTKWQWESKNLVNRDFLLTVLYLWPLQHHLQACRYLRTALEVATTTATPATAAPTTKATPAPAFLLEQWTFLCILHTLRMKQRWALLPMKKYYFKKNLWMWPLRKKFTNIMFHWNLKKWSQFSRMKLLMKLIFQVRTRQVQLLHNS